MYNCIYKNHKNSGFSFYIISFKFWALIGLFPKKEIFVLVTEFSD